MIQCPVQVPVCCMFLVSQNIHIKRNPNGIKIDGAYFWNIWKIPEEKSTRGCARGVHEAGGVPATPGRAPDPRGPPVRRLMPFFGRKKDNFWKKIWAKVSIQSELRISRYKRNGARAESQNAETERDRSNLGGALAPPTPWRPRTRGETLLPSREEVKEEEEGGGLSPPSLSVAPECHRGPLSSLRSTPTTSLPS